MSSGSQLFGGMEPIFLGRSLRTASFLPQFMRQCGDVVVPERGDAVPARNRLGMSVGPLGVLKRLPGMLVPGKVILVGMLLGNPMGMSGVVRAIRRRVDGSRSAIRYCSESTSFRGSTICPDLAWASFARL